MLAASNDRWLTSEAIEDENTPTVRHLANAVKPLGTPILILPAAALLYAAGHWGSNPSLARRALCGGASIIVAGVMVQGLKVAIGRERPYESPDDAFLFKPFSGHESLPSGHTAIAFAAAAAIDHETSERWIPYVAYPVAALVGWSRVRDRQHWTSDVIAGATLGGWTAWKTDGLLAARYTGSKHAPGAWRVIPAAHGAGLVFTGRF